VNNGHRNSLSPFTANSPSMKQDCYITIYTI